MKVRLMLFALAVIVIGVPSAMACPDCVDNACMLRQPSGLYICWNEEGGCVGYGFCESFGSTPELATEWKVASVRVIRDEKALPNTLNAQPQVASVKTSSPPLRH